MFGEAPEKRELSLKVESPRSYSPQSRGEAICNRYIDLIHRKSQVCVPGEKPPDPSERPFDPCDDEEFAFGINLLNNNVACANADLSTLIQLAQEPWPDDVKLYQPYEVEQILLPDNASCLAVQAFLKMCNLPFEIEMKWNAEFMSPTGRVPFIKCGAFVIPELEQIVQFVADKGVSLTSKLSVEEKAKMRTFISLVNVLIYAELYISWLDDETFQTVTKVRNSSVYPWPLGWYQTRGKRAQVLNRLKALQWHDKTIEKVIEEVDKCCTLLSDLLEDKDFFFDTPTQLDALVYGHVRALLSHQGPKVSLLIKPLTTSLLQHTRRIANLTRMKFTTQEEYLLSQGLNVTKRSISPDQNLDRHQKRRTRLTRDGSKISIMYDTRDVFGFKPFASKQIIIMQSDDGTLTCDIDTSNESSRIETASLVDTFISDLLDKTCEVVSRNAFYEGFELLPMNAQTSNSTYSQFNNLATIDELLDLSLSTTETDVTTINNIDDTTFVVGVPVPSPENIRKQLKEMEIPEFDYEVNEESPTELDALVFGHIFTILTTRIPCRKLADTVKKHHKLISLVSRIEDTYFKRSKTVVKDILTKFS